MALLSVCLRTHDGHRDGLLCYFLREGCPGVVREHLFVEDQLGYRGPHQVAREPRCRHERGAALIPELLYAAFQRGPHVYADVWEDHLSMKFPGVEGQLGFGGLLLVPRRVSFDLCVFKQLCTTTCCTSTRFLHG